MAVIPLVVFHQYCSFRHYYSRILLWCPCM